MLLENDCKLFICFTLNFFEMSQLAEVIWLLEERDLKQILCF